MGSSKVEQLLDHLEEFCTDRTAAGAKRQDMLLGNVWTHEGQHHFVFREFLASTITALSTHPPETEPKISSFELIRSIEPTGLGALFQVSITRAKAKLSSFTI